ncbi:uncharacterized protein LOC135925381 [Gordionus sp. m RMFG-2023]|uniref:uncharacterized protein LOC135925381 n=1 Tax=Gordionus sp. m RMFG-2023 TaxID=3053472 RepID=UPI0031FD59C4
MLDCYVKLYKIDPLLGPLVQSQLPNPVSKPRTLVNHQLKHSLCDNRLNDIVHAKKMEDLINCLPGVDNTRMRSNSEMDVMKNLRPDMGNEFREIQEYGEARKKSFYSYALADYSKLNICSVCFRSFSLNCDLRDHMFFEHTIHNSPQLALNARILDKQIFQDEFCKGLMLRNLSSCVEVIKSDSNHNNKVNSPTFEVSVRPESIATLNESGNHESRETYYTDREILKKRRRVKRISEDYLYEADFVPNQGEPFKRAILDNNEAQIEKNFDNITAIGLDNKNTMTRAGSSSDFQDAAKGSCETLYMGKKRGRKPKMTFDLIETPYSLPNHVDQTSPLSKSNYQPDGNCVCTVCHKDFEWPSKLRRHFDSVHLRLKPFTCHLCSEKFSSKLGLDGHVSSTHEKRKPYVCPLCPLGYNDRGSIRARPKAFAFKASLRNHVAVAHREDLLKSEQAREMSLEIVGRGDLEGNLITTNDYDSPNSIKMEPSEVFQNMELGATEHLVEDSNDSAPGEFKLEQGFVQDESLVSQEFIDNSFDPSINKGKKKRDGSFIKVGENLKVNLKIYRCDVCSKIFNQSGHLTRHFKVVHMKVGLFKCYICSGTEKQDTEDVKEDRLFHSKASLKNHIRRFHQGCRTHKYGCEECGMSYADRKSVENHRLKAHHHGTSFNPISDWGSTPAGTLVYRCPLGPCGKTFAAKLHLTIHIKKFHPYLHERLRRFKKIPVTRPTSVSRKNTLYIKGAETDSGPYRNVTDIDLALDAEDSRVEINEPTTTPTMMMLGHQNNLVISTQTLGDSEIGSTMEGGGPTFLCDSCQETFADRHSLVRHVRHFHEEKSYVCHICGRSYYQKPHLNRHLASTIHADVLPHQCNYCGKRFAQYPQLRKHLVDLFYHRDPTLLSAPKFMCHLCTPSQAFLPPGMDINTYVNDINTVLLQEENELNSGNKSPLMIPPENEFDEDEQTRVHLDIVDRVHLGTGEPVNIKNNSTTITKLVEEILPSSSPDVLIASSKNIIDFDRSNNTRPKFAGPDEPDDYFYYNINNDINAVENYFEPYTPIVPPSFDPAIVTKEGRPPPIRIVRFPNMKELVSHLKKFHPDFDPFTGTDNLGVPNKRVCFRILPPFMTHPSVSVQSYENPQSTFTGPAIFNDGNMNNMPVSMNEYDPNQPPINDQIHNGGLNNPETYYYDSQNNYYLLSNPNVSTTPDLRNSPTTQYS